MKLSDKALWQIGRKLLDRMDTPLNQDDSPTPEQLPADTACDVTPQDHVAAVLPFRKHPR